MGSVSKVVVVGAGLGGLACAITSRLQGIKVTILERAPKISNVGAGIQIPPNSAKVLKSIGVLTKIETVSTVVDTLDVKRYSDGKILSRRPLGENAQKVFGANWMVIHREDYHSVLLEEALALGAELELGAQVDSIDSSGTHVTLADGSRRTADVVVGADGLWSSTRESFLNKASPPSETGDLAYRATFSLEQLKSLNNPSVEALCAQKSVALWMGPQKHCVFYPLRSGTEFNLVLLRPDDLPPNVRAEEGDIFEMRAAFEGWDPILTLLISCISSVLKWKLLHHDELDTWTQGHAALLGDACHPTLPYQAQGAAMAVEDGGVLGVLLGMYNKSKLESIPKALPRDATIPALLSLYEQLRKQRTTVNVQGAVRNRWFYHLPDGEEQKARDVEMANYDFVGGRSSYSWLDSKYTMNLLGFDALEDARKAYITWLDEFENPLRKLEHVTSARVSMEASLLTQQAAAT